MPGPGPRGPRQTYRTPCSSSLDPRKKAKSRRARGTRTRQPGTRSTRDGLLCGENRSAAGGTRARAARRQLETGAQQIEIEQRALDPRPSSSSSSSSSPAAEALGPGIRSPGLDSCKFVPVSYPTLSHLAFLIRGPGISGHFASKNNHLPRIAARGPGCVPAGAWAMFLTNNPVKNDMTVSRETVPNY